MTKPDLKAIRERCVQLYHELCDDKWDASFDLVRDAFDLIDYIDELEAQIKPPAGDEGE